MKSSFALLVLVCLPIAPLLGQTTGTAGFPTLPTPLDPADDDILERLISVHDLFGLEQRRGVESLDARPLRARPTRSDTWVVGFSAFDGGGAFPRRTST